MIWDVISRRPVLLTAGNAVGPLFLRGGRWHIASPIGEVIAHRSGRAAAPLPSSGGEPAWKPISVASGGQAFPDRL
jgi:hypothetical protein